MMHDYRPEEHYWIVAGDGSRLWSSAAAAYVPADDEAYRAWSSNGGLPARIASEAELDAVLAAAGLGERAPNPPRRRVEKTLIVARLTSIGQIAAAKAALEADASAWARWLAPVSSINHDDPDALALLAVIDADAGDIMAP